MAYPLRQRAVRDRVVLGLDVLRHPGYGNRGAVTPAYCRELARYRVSVATASMYGFALRKIIEAVAVGCTVITDLPAYDVLPEIDAALIRVPSTINPPDFAAVIRDAVAAGTEAGLRAMTTVNPSHTAPTTVAQCSLGVGIDTNRSSEIPHSATASIPRFGNPTAHAQPDSATASTASPSASVSEGESE